MAAHGQRRIHRGSLHPAPRPPRRPPTGMALAMVGADVVLTDTADVLGLLRINYEVGGGGTLSAD